MWPFSKKLKDTWGVRQVAWGNYRHAYGPATDVPEQLLSLQHPDAKIRDAALFKLFSNIYHQGTVYEASQYAVPFLIQIAENQNVLGRSGAILLLASLGQGTSYHDVHRQVLGKRSMPQHKLDAIVAEELRHVRSCRNRVVEGLDSYVAMLHDSDPAVRIGLGYLLGVLGKEAGEHREAICAATKSESEPEAAASLLLGLSKVGIELQSLQELTASMTCRRQDVVRLAKNLCVLIIAKEESPAEAVQDVVRMLAQPPDLVHSVSWETWFEGGPQAISLDVLACIGKERLTRHLDSMIGLLLSKQQFDADGLIRLLLFTTFGDSRYSEASTSLSSDQKRVIVALYDCDRVILRGLGPRSYDANAFLILKSYRLPSEEEKLRDLAERCR